MVAGSGHLGGLSVTSFRVGVASILSSATIAEASAVVRAAAFATGLRKHEFQEMGWSCIPLEVETYRNWVKRGTVCILPISLIASIGQASSKAKRVTEIYDHLNLSLVRSVGRAILGKESAGVLENCRLDLVYVCVLLAYLMYCIR